jgi:hypothetical protein
MTIQQSALIAAESKKRQKPNTKVYKKLNK